RDWQQQAVRAAESDAAFAAVASAAGARPRPAVVVAGDYSAGKSSFIKRMIAEFGGETPQSLHIRADATTEEVGRYPLGTVEIIDTPGFQSRREGHDDLALAGSREAALVIVLLHVNLLIGDTTALQKIAHGTSTAAGKWPRMLFVINRCDELGVDPIDSVAEYFHRRDRKCAELVAALNSRGIHVAPSHIHGVASDPFGSVGALLPVESANYAANRGWDGIAALVDALRAWAGNDLDRASALVAFDDALTKLLTLRESTRTGIDTYRAETGKHDSLIASMDICLEDAKYLRQSLEHELADALARPVLQAIGKIREVETGKEQALAKAIDSWHSDPETASELERFMRRATEKVNDWSATHQSAISREETAAGFDAKLDLPGAQSAGGGGDGLGRVVGAAGWAAGIGKNLGKVLGNREAALQIGHFFGHKFKPWGAIKAGKAVGRVGVVLGVVAVAADAATWANQVSKMKDWDSKRDAAVDKVESDSREFLRKMIDEPEGPWSYLDARAGQVRGLRDQYRERQLAAQDEAERLQQRLATANDLVEAAQEIRKVIVDE
ncbi:MAG: hypothetical protein QG597_4671, partial [Actinomycetota bacterium]|nr:hypothetical protein [Actinomycetota bacterium]